MASNPECRQHAAPSLAILPAVFFISFSAIGWQLALMRCLLISRYHHFSFLVISSALLGYGLGGAVLSLWRTSFQARRDSIFRWGTFIFGISLPICFRSGEALPLNVYFAPATLVSTLSWWFLFWGIHILPFLLAGFLTGLALMSSGGEAHKVYATNLAGCAAGALGGIALLQYLPANGVVVPLSLLVLLSCVSLIPAANSRVRAAYVCALVLLALLVGGAGWIGPDKAFLLRIDEYKPLAYVDRLVKQGSANREYILNGPRGRVELFSGPTFHTMLSLDSRTPPPPMDILLKDGFQVGFVLDIGSLQQAEFLRETLSEMPYRLVQPKSILVLGEAGSLYTWLARLSPASSIVVVQPDQNVLRILETHPSGVLRDPRLRLVQAEPRAFLDNTRETFDIIHLAELEGFAAGSGGIGGLREDYLATVEGFGKCLEALTPGGVASVVRGIQDPPRDNIKISATWIEAMEKAGVKDPGNRILMARDELAMVTIAGRREFSPLVTERFRETCKSMSWDSDWYPGVQDDTTNKIHVLPGPRDSTLSWYNYAMRQMLSNERDTFYRNWIANVRPATDDSPFFHDFFRWASLSRFREAFGPLWPARSEMGFLLLLVSLVWTSCVAAFLLPLAVVQLWREKDSPPFHLIAVVVLYFASIGTGFMLLEMSFIQSFTRFLGDPIVAAATVVGGFLFFAGIGSLVQPELIRRIPGGILALGLCTGALIVFYSWLFPHLFAGAAGLPHSWKLAVGLGTIAPLAFTLGLFFPSGLAQVHRRADAAVPLAWATNGFASVVATSGAVILAMTHGFVYLSLVAALIYGATGILSSHLGSTTR